VTVLFRGRVGLHSWSVQSYHRVYVELRMQDGRQIADMLRKGQESERVLRRASILRQLC
jgi:hypothetical protein